MPNVFAFVATQKYCPKGWKIFHAKNIYFNSFSCAFLRLILLYHLIYCISKSNWWVSNFNELEPARSPKKIYAQHVKRNRNQLNDHSDRNDIQQKQGHGQCQRLAKKVLSNEVTSIRTESAEFVELIFYWGKWQPAEHGFVVLSKW